MVPKDIRLHDERWRTKYRPLVRSNLLESFHRLQLAIAGERNSFPLFDTNLILEIYSNKVTAFLTLQNVREK